MRIVAKIIETILSALILIILSPVLLASVVIMLGIFTFDALTDD